MDAGISQSCCQSPNQSTLACSLAAIYLSQTPTHTQAHTQHAALVHFPFLTTTLASLTHTRTHTFAFPLPALTRCFFSLTHTFCRFLGSAAVICCCHLTCHPSPPHTHTRSHSVLYFTVCTAHIIGFLLQKIAAPLVCFHYL